MEYLHGIKFWFFLVAMLFQGLLSKIHCQDICEGHLGENIFEEGDFGIGQNNILLVDPQIAPGYIYTTDVPPKDGYYVLTNSTARWPDQNKAWLSIEDNSANPNGYMMVVNASFDPDIFYLEVIEDLCENTEYEFSADIINLIKAGETDHVKPNVSFLINDIEKYSSGDISQSERWNTYGFKFQTDPGQTQITLTLRNNAPGGRGNDLALDNISFRACGPASLIDVDTTIFLCQNDSEFGSFSANITEDNYIIQWQSSPDGEANWVDLKDETNDTLFHTTADAGSFFFRYLTATTQENLSNFKCRIVSNVFEINVLPSEYHFSDTICQDVSFEFGSEELLEGGTYFGEFISSKGCDSIVTLDLHVVPNNIQFELLPQDPSCSGDENGKIEIVDLSGISLPYSSVLNNTDTSSGSFTDLGPGNYELTVVDRYKCTLSKSVILSDPDLFLINVGPDLTLDLGELSETIVVESEYEIISINWDPKEFLECIDCIENHIMGSFDLTYVVTAENNNGCIATDIINVTVNKESLKIYIPNAFSPNGDGVNDFFQIFSKDETVVVVESMLIYDRWGGVVYSADMFTPNLINGGWNGMYNGNVVPNGVYAYFARIRLFNGSFITRSGTVSVLN